VSSVPATQRCTQEVVSVTARATTKRATTCHRAPLHWKLSTCCRKFPTTSVFRRRAVPRAAADRAPVRAAQHEGGVRIEGPHSRGHPRPAVRLRRAAVAHDAVDGHRGMRPDVHSHREVVRAPRRRPARPRLRLLRLPWRRAAHSASMVRFACTPAASVSARVTAPGAAPAPASASPRSREGRRSTRACPGSAAAWPGEPERQRDAGPG